MNAVENIRCSNLFKKLLYTILICFLSYGAAAHKVNIFAEVDSGIVNISCYYSKGKKVRSGEIKVLETKNGNLIYKGITDESGFLSFKIPEAAMKYNSDLKIILDAGMGHRAEWNISYKEILESQKILKNEKTVESSEISFLKVIFGLTVLFIVFTLAYFLTKKKKGNIS